MLVIYTPTFTLHVKCRHELDYSFESGLLSWKNPTKKFYKPLVGYEIRDNGKYKGRRIVSWEGNKIMYTTLVWFWIYGKLPECTIDHIDKNPGNNRIENLRDVSCSTQLMNRSFAKHKDKLARARAVK